MILQQPGRVGKPLHCLPMYAIDRREVCETRWVEALERVFKSVTSQVLRNGETGVYWAYMRISSTVQRSNRAA